MNTSQQGHENTSPTEVVWVGFLFFFLSTVWQLSSEPFSCVWLKLYWFHCSHSAFWTKYEQACECMIKVTTLDLICSLHERRVKSGSLWKGSNRGKLHWPVGFLRGIKTASRCDLIWRTKLIWFWACRISNASRPMTSSIPKNYANILLKPECWHEAFFFLFFFLVSRGVSSISLFCFRRMNSDLKGN